MHTASFFPICNFSPYPLITNVTCDEIITTNKTCAVTGSHTNTSNTILATTHDNNHTEDMYSLTSSTSAPTTDPNTYSDATSTYSEQDPTNTDINTKNADTDSDTNTTNTDTTTTNTKYTSDTNAPTMNTSFFTTYQYYCRFFIFCIFLMLFKSYVFKVQCSTYYNSRGNNYLNLTIFNKNRTNVFFIRGITMEGNEFRRVGMAYGSDGSPLSKMEFQLIHL